MRIPVTNSALGTEARINLRDDGLIAPHTVRRVREKLGVLPGYAGAGVLGEEGEQPVIDGWQYAFVSIGEDGWVQAIPEPAAVPAGRER